MSVLGRLALLVDGRRPPGVYATRPAALAATCAAALVAAGVDARVLDTTGATGKADVLARCARDLALPTWFGHNWDALVDALRDRRGVVLWHGATDVDPAVAEIALDVFADRAAAPPAFTLVVLDPPPDLPVPPL